MTATKPIDAFKKGQRVQLHPDTDTAVGDRWGEVVIVGDKYVHVLLDVSGHLPSAGSSAMANIVARRIMVSPR
jgi:hypothetical protein